MSILGLKCTKLIFDFPRGPLQTPLYLRGLLLRKGRWKRKEGNGEADRKGREGRSEREGPVKSVKQGPQGS